MMAAYKDAHHFYQSAQDFRSIEETPSGSVALFTFTRHASCEIGRIRFTSDSITVCNPERPFRVLTAYQRNTRCVEHFKFSF